MAYGDINIQSLTVGGLNLATPNPSLFASTINIYESILDPLGPHGEIRVVDAIDALGQANINGKEDVQITFSSGGQMGGSTKTMKFKLLQNSNLQDGSESSYGSGRNKQYTLKLVRPELIAAQGNYVQKSYNALTSDMVKDIIKNYLKSDAQIEIRESTRGQRRFVFNQDHPVAALKKLDNEHVSAQNESSLFALFMTDDGGQQKYVFTTYEQLFTQGPVATLTESTGLGSGMVSDREKENSIIWFRASDSFFTASRPLNNATAQPYNLASGKQYIHRPEQKYNFKYADSGGVYNNYSGEAAVPRPVVNDTLNNKNQKTYVADARQKRAAYISHLAQNAAELEIPGNTNIKVGSMIQLNIPGKTDATMTNNGERQMNGKALVVSIRHKVKPITESPRYTMILRVVKASFKEGGGGNG
jgi:hypothetical protein